MAYDVEQWKRAKGYFEAGLSLSKIKDKTGIARNTISQRAKREQWEQGKNTDYIEAREIVATEKGTILEQSGSVALEIADNIADDNIRRKKLVYGITEKILKNIDKTISQPVVTTDEKGVKKEEEMQLDSKTAKEYIEAIDKASLTLGVNQRHSNSQVQITNTNAQQNNKELTTAEAQREAELLGVPLSALL